jgi:hypothetical protein
VNDDDDDDDDKEFQQVLKQDYIFDRLNYIKKEGLIVTLETETMYNGDGDGVDDGATNTIFNTTGGSLSSLLACITIMRKRYCSKELPSKEQNQLSKSSYIPNGLFDFQFNETTATAATTDSENANVNANNINNIINRFDALQYKYYNPGRDSNPKSIIDLSQPG